jgi:hypothetical protein
MSVTAQLRRGGALDLLFERKRNLDMPG